MGAGEFPGDERPSARPPLHGSDAQAQWLVTWHSCWFYLSRRFLLALIDMARSIVQVVLQGSTSMLIERAAGKRIDPKTGGEICDSVERAQLIPTALFT